MDLENLKTQVKKERLQSRDLITIGLFSAVFIAIWFVVIMVGYLILGPIHSIFSTAVIALLGGVILIPLGTKVRKKGVFFITGTMWMIFFVFTTGAWWFIILSLGGFLADVIASKNQYKGEKELGLAYAIFMWSYVIGSFAPIYLFRDYFVQYMMQMAAGTPMADPAYWADSLSYWTTEALIILIIVSIVGAVAGAYIGIKVYKKHFEKAGIV